MDNLKCPNCSNFVLNDSKYCVNCGLYLLDNQQFLDEAVESLRKEKAGLLGDIYFVISDSIDNEIKQALDVIAVKVELIYDVLEGILCSCEDTRLQICETLDESLSEVSDLTELQRKKVESRAQKDSVLEKLDAYQITLEEIKESLEEDNESDVEVDVEMSSLNESFE